jgi:hypothetical protein
MASPVRISNAAVKHFTGFNDTATIVNRALQWKKYAAVNQQNAVLVL